VIVAEAQRHGIAVLSVTTTPSAFKGTSALADGRPTIRTTLGIHPELAQARAHESAMYY
jgi:TatD DNase family protein